MYLSNLIIKPASTTHHVLTATSVESTTEISTPVFNQVHALTPTSVESASEASAPTLSQTHALTATSVESTSQVSQPTVTDFPSGADHNLLPDDVESASEVTAPILGQVHVIAATDVESLSSVDSPSLAQIQALLATGVECATELSTPALSDNGSVSLASLQAQIAELTAAIPGMIQAALTAQGVTSARMAEMDSIPAILADTADMQPKVTESNKILKNKQITNPATGKHQVFDDDDSTVLLEADAWENAGGTTPYQGNALNRRDRLQTP